MVSRQVQSILTRELQVTDQVFRRVMKARAEHMLEKAELLASDFALKKAFATRDDLTLLSVAQNYRDRTKGDVLWLTDETGVLFADSSGKFAGGKELAILPAFEEAFTAAAPTVLVIEIDDKIFQFMVVPILAPRVIGFLLLGTSIGDITVQQLKEETGSEVSFLTQARLFSSSWLSTERELLTSNQLPMQAIFQHPPDQTFLLTLNGERFLSLLVPIQAQLSAPLYALVQRSYDAALAPLSALRWNIVGIGFAALLGALLLGSRLTAGITAPIQTLVQSMQHVLRGNFSQRIAVKRQDEIGFLGSSFNEMVSGLEEREQLKDTFGRFVHKMWPMPCSTAMFPLLANDARSVFCFKIFVASPPLVSALTRQSWFACSISFSLRWLPQLKPKEEWSSNLPVTASWHCLAHRMYILTAQPALCARHSAWLTDSHH
ncbi:MAG: HAMP domain-containing protein [Deltaproteobacteria bacterium]|nr:HAMP domain-containing protein [Deltaproteobacteria bacterium]